MTKTRRSMLPSFESHTVSKAAVKITKAGDGLSAALKLDPIALDLGDEIYYVLKGRVVKISHDEDKDNIVTRMHTVATDGITPISAEDAERYLLEAREALERRQAEVTGQTMLGDGEDKDNVTRIDGKKANP